MYSISQIHSNNSIIATHLVVRWLVCRRKGLFILYTYIRRSPSYIISSAAVHSHHNMHKRTRSTTKRSRKRSLLNTSRHPMKTPPTPRLGNNPHSITTADTNPETTETATADCCRLTTESGEKEKDLNLEDVRVNAPVPRYQK